MGTPRGLLDDLRAVGVEVDDVWALVNRRRPYPEAIPVLLDWLQRLDERGMASSEDPKLREGLVVHRGSYTYVIYCGHALTPAQVASW
jgi:hypothetical protein